MLLIQKIVDYTILLNGIKNKEVEEPQYNEESSDNDINKNINIDAYNRKYNNKNRIIHSKYRHKNIPNILSKNKSKNIKEIEKSINELVDWEKNRKKILLGKLKKN